MNLLIANYAINPLPHCHCRYPCCDKKDDCECTLFDAVTVG